jgi:hypothetical protein
MLFAIPVWNTLQIYAMPRQSWIAMDAAIGPNLCDVFIKNLLKI